LLISKSPLLVVAAVLSQKLIQVGSGRVIALTMPSWPFFGIGKGHEITAFRKPTWLPSTTISAVLAFSMAAL
jgi:hypothetical protein